MLVQIHILINKWCRSSSVGFFRSQLILICRVYKGRAYLGSAGPRVIWRKLFNQHLLSDWNNVYNITILKKQNERKKKDSKLVKSYSILTDVVWLVFYRSEEREEEKDEDVDVNQSLSSMATASNMEVCCLSFTHCQSLVSGENIRKRFQNIIYRNFLSKP